jgi:D-arabinitol dehydrogenase (NADP+)
MKAVLYDAPRRFSVATLPTPEPGPGEVRVAMAATGICGPDLHSHDGRFFASFPLTPGHERFGVVDALEDGVLWYGVTRPDDRVAVSRTTSLDRFADALEAVRSDTSCLKAAVEL